MIALRDFQIMLGNYTYFNMCFQNEDVIISKRMFCSWEEFRTTNIHNVKTPTLPVLVWEEFRTTNILDVKTPTVPILVNPYGRRSVSPSSLSSLSLLSVPMSLFLPLYFTISSPLFLRVATVRFGYGSCMERFERFRFSVPTVARRKAFFEAAQTVN